MREITSIVCLVSSLALFSQSAKDFKWLKGNWKRENNKPGTLTLESWTLSKKTLVGKGVTLKGNDTTFVEHLKIVQKGGSWNYVAEVAHNNEPTYFQIDEVTKDGFISSNPTHDFPKQIEYKKTKEGMVVTISGNGKAILFVFKRTDE